MRKYKGLTPDAFNSAVPVGTDVRYYKRLPADEDDFVRDVTASPAWDAYGRTVVMLHETSGCVDAGHLVVRNPSRPVPGLLGWWND